MSIDMPVDIRCQQGPYCLTGLSNALFLILVVFKKEKLENRAC